MNSRELEDAIATQSMLVECMGMTNCAQLTASERMLSHARYLSARAKLDALRNALVHAVQDEVSFLYRYEGQTH